MPISNLRIKNKFVDDAVITAAKIASDAVTEIKILNSAVTENKIGTGAVVASKIGAEAVTSAKIADGAVLEAKLGALSVVEGKLGALSVTEGKLGAGSVTEEKIGALAVSTGKLAALAVTAEKIGADAVISAKIQDGAVLKAKIAADAVDQSKMLLDNNSAFRAKNVAGSAVNLLKLNGSDQLEMALPPKMASYEAPVGDSSFAQKKYVDDADALKLNATLKGAVNGLAELGADGKIPSAQLPAIAITDTFVVASQAAMLALSSAEVGDVAVRTDLNKSFILKEAGYGTLGNWQELLTPTDSVFSVNGQVGTVVLDTDDLLEGTNKFYHITTARGDIIAASISDSDTTHAPSGEAVYEALLLKANDSVVVKTVNGESPISGAITLTSPDIGFTPAVAGNWDGGTSEVKGALDQLGADMVQAQSDLSGAMTDIDDLESGSMGIQPGHTAFLLDATAISNQYVTMTGVIVKYGAQGAGMSVSVGRLRMHQGIDFTVSTVSGNTRITFAGPMASGGDEALVDGDWLFVEYLKMA